MRMEGWASSLRAVYDVMSPELREAWELYYGWRNSAEAVAAHLNVSVDTLRQWRQVIAGAILHRMGR
jgi:hypothetical protein